jgi:hypothetical protein
MMYTRYDRMMGSGDETRRANLGAETSSHLEEEIWPAPHTAKCVSTDFDTRETLQADTRSEDVKKEEK